MLFRSTFTLTATPTGGTAVTGTATIKDDGTGTIYNADGTLDTTTAKNNDITVSSPTVNEASPYAVFTVTATQGQNLTLALADGTAGGSATDYGSTNTTTLGQTNLEYSLDGGSTWVIYSGAFNATLTGAAPSYEWSFTTGANNLPPDSSLDTGTSYYVNTRALDLAGNFQTAISTILFTFDNQPPEIGRAHV